MCYLAVSFCIDIGNLDILDSGRYGGLEGPFLLHRNNTGMDMDKGIGMGIGMGVRFR